MRNEEIRSELRATRSMDQVSKSFKFSRLNLHSPLRNLHDLNIKTQKLIIGHYDNWIEASAGYEEDCAFNPCDHFSSPGSFSNYISKVMVRLCLNQDCPNYEEFEGEDIQPNECILQECAEINKDWANSEAQHQQYLQELEEEERLAFEEIAKKHPLYDFM
jgi:hypothetical protein